MGNLFRYRHHAPTLCCLLGVLLGLATARRSFAQQQAADAVDATVSHSRLYLTQVKPLLQQRCYACHGALKQEAGLRLDTVEQMLHGGDSGPVIVAGDAADSLLLARVAAEEVGERMPPEFEGEPLSADQLAGLAEWITAGAAAPQDEQPEADPEDHWSFREIRRPPVPSVRRGGWLRNPIDAFVARQHEQLGLAPQAEASNLALLRRLSLDLIGLPPSAAEIAALQNDHGPGWYERAVTRLLNDPRHGERWARHWMDIWRYSDWWGLGDQLRNSQKHIWHWRDWIVQSLNADTPYDEMVRLMLAADELHPNDLQRLSATGYLARNFFLFNRHQWMDETVEHVGKGFLGLTMNCAKCHDHKYDPISHTDYYALRAFFEPYHVRLDVTPGEADLARDGIPRAFDALLDAPTYRFIRGQETEPDTSVVISPGVPEVLEFAPLQIESLELPVEAWQPQRRPWVAEAHRIAARKQIDAAAAKLSSARDQLAAALQAEKQGLAKLEDERPSAAAAEPEDDRKIIRETFETLDSDRWQLLGGQWKHEPGRLEQQQDGATRAVLRLLTAAPRDFEATLRVTILGGSQWRSIGISFDASQADPTAAAAAEDSEQQVYVSAHAGGPKVQAAVAQGGKWQYPSDAMVAQPIETGRQYALGLQVRDTLVNVSLDGQPLFAWRSPMARREGNWQVTTFDALVAVHEITLMPLAADVVLREPVGSPPNLATPAGAVHAVAEARLELQLAEIAQAVAQAELHRVDQVAAAMRATDPQADGVGANGESEAVQAGEAVRAAARAEHELKVAQARQALAEAELRLHRAAANQREAVEKEVAAARETLDQSLQPLDPSSEQYTALVGAQWTPTRFADSGKDDPAIGFERRSSGRRTALADWITDRRNPLAARVAVNHIWNRHFGTPLVPTVFDFGRNGRPPTHPELLDWLAAELIESGWSMKHLHRLIVQSATYRLSSSSTGAEASANKDPDNTHYWRRTPTRLESQAVRDSVLALAGSLEATFGGPPVPPAAQTASRRRSLYFFHSNNERNLFLSMFDEALVKECYRREQSIVPQQALAMTNSRLVLDAAPLIAERLTRAVAAAGKRADDDAAWIQLSFKVLLGAEPSEAEAVACARSLDAWRALPGTLPEDAGNDFARSNLVWVLLNHNDFVTLR